jgi:hypothetical protein
MATPVTTEGERVVKVIEICERKVVRIFYCIRDPEFDQWMSEEPFDGLIWTKDPKRRQEFCTRKEAEGTLAAFEEWREEREDDILQEDEAA